SGTPFSTTPALWKSSAGRPRRFRVTATPCWLSAAPAVLATNTGAGPGLRLRRPPRRDAPDDGFGAASLGERPHRVVEIRVDARRRTELAARREAEAVVLRIQRGAQHRRGRPRRGD